MTPSLNNFLWSLLWGGVVIGVLVPGALIFISQLDKIKRS